MTRTTRVLVIVVWLAVAGFATLELSMSGVPRADNPFLPAIATSALLFGTLGAMVLARHPGHRMGELLLGTGVLSAAELTATAYADAALFDGWPLPGGAWALWVSRWLWTLPLSATALLLLHFPTGRPPSRQWRVPAVLMIVVAGWLAVSQAVLPLSETTDLPHPIPDPHWIAPLDAALTMSSAASAALVVCLLAATVSLLGRFRRATGTERLQLRWFLLIAAFIPPAVIGSMLLPIANAGVGEMLLVPALGAAMGVAMLRRRLWDIDVAVNRTLVWTALTVTLVGGYTTVVGVLGRLLSGTVAALPPAVAAAAVAAVLVPLHRRLQEGVDRLQFGLRRDPYALVSHMHRVSAGATADDLPERIAQVLADALRVPYAAVEIETPDGDVLRGASGEDRYGVTAVPLRDRDIQIGCLIVGRRSPDEVLSESDRRLLDLLAMQTGLTAGMLRLARDLQRSRERIVAGREDERRRLRRDLHDGLGPALAGLAAGLEGAAALGEQDPDEALTILPLLAEQARDAMAEARRVVEGLRPSALDDLGLVGAVRRYAAGLASAGVLTVAVETTGDPSVFPAAVEVAAYRIATEALANVVKHARAAVCRVTFGYDLKEFVVAVADDGRGVRPDTAVSVGLAAMPERAAEIGGTFVVSSAPDQGTTVTARLPLTVMS